MSKSSGDEVEKTMSVKQLGHLLFKVENEPRRGAKKYLRDLGGDGSAAELDRAILFAKASSEAVAESERILRQYKLRARAIKQGIDGHVAEMIADVRLAMEDQGLTQSDIAHKCEWKQPLVSDYLNGVKEPGARNLAKLASAVGCVWRLQPTEAD